ncbi:hypothetical protein AB0M87_32115 [Streptomyces sp. NPDC051320]|uniref:hypothetical protein n=1 Tax=Streptomyces sp. NPDC051320 TaxID=3154644 RepID=UPI00343958D0
MTLLSAAEFAEFAGEFSLALGSNCRVELSSDGLEALVIDDEGRALGLLPVRTGRVAISVQLPSAAASLGISVKPVTVTARCGARHAAAHVRRKLLPAHADAVTQLREQRSAQPADQAEPDRKHSAVDAKRVSAALNKVAPAFGEHSSGGWVLDPRRSRGSSRPAVRWQSGLSDQAMRDRAVVAMSPYLADALRRDGLSTTETRRGDVVFFAPPAPEAGAARYAVTASLDRPGVRDLVDSHTGASVRGCTDEKRVQELAEELNAEAERRRNCGHASLALPGLSAAAVEWAELRCLAVDLARSGHMPYGVASVNYADVPGFLILRGDRSVAYVHRLLDPWGDARPGQRRYGPPVASRRFDKDLAAYAACLPALPGQAAGRPRGPAACVWSSGAERGGGVGLRDIRLPQPAAWVLWNMSTRSRAIGRGVPMATGIAAQHVSKSGKSFEVHDRGYDDQGYYCHKAIMITRDVNEEVIDQLYANTGAR